jgi:thiol-disulfide isomerase/thioredoxin
MNNAEHNVAAARGQARRQWLTLGVAAAATVAGAGLAWRSMKEEQGVGHPSTTGSVAGKEGASDSEKAFWGMRFDAPTGDALLMQSFMGRPLLLNFWATWCPPCVEELPLLNQFFGENKAKSWQVIGLAIDQPNAVRKFLEKTPLNFPVAMGGLEGTEISRSLGNSAGSLPFSVVFDAQGRIVHRKIGTLGAAELQTLREAYTPV